MFQKGLHVIWPHFSLPFSLQTHTQSGKPWEWQFFTRFGASLCSVPVQSSKVYQLVRHFRPPHQRRCQTRAHCKLRPRPRTKWIVCPEANCQKSSENREDLHVSFFNSNRMTRSWVSLIFILCDYSHVLTGISNWRCGRVQHGHHPQVNARVVYVVSCKKTLSSLHPPNSSNYSNNNTNTHHTTPKPLHLAIRRLLPLLPSLVQPRLTTVSRSHLIREVLKMRLGSL